MIPVPSQHYWEEMLNEMVMFDFTATTIVGTDNRCPVKAAGHETQNTKSLYSAGNILRLKLPLLRFLWMHSESSSSAWEK